MNHPCHTAHATRTRPRGRGTAVTVLLAALAVLCPAAVGTAQQAPQPTIPVVPAVVPDWVKLSQEDLRHQARILADRLAGLYSQWLADQVGQPVRRQLHLLAETEVKNSVRRADQAGEVLASVSRSTEQQAGELARTEARLLELQKELKEARARKNQRQVTELESRVRSLRSKILTASSHAQSADRKVRQTIETMTATWPDLVATLKTGAMQDAGAGIRHTQAAVRALERHQLVEAAAAMKVSTMHLRRLADATRRLYAALEIHRAETAAERLALATDDAAESLRLFARTTTRKEGEPQVFFDQIRTMEQALQRSADAVAAGQQTGAALKKAVAALKATPQAVDRIEPHVTRALADLRQGAEHLGRVNPERAGASLGAAAGHLHTLARDLRAARLRFGLKGETRADTLARAVGTWLPGKLGKQVEGQLTDAHRKAVLPALLQAASRTADQLLPGDGSMKAAREALLKNLEGMLGADLLGRVKAAERFAEGAGQPLRQADGQASARDMPLVQTAEQAARVLINRQLDMLTQVGISQARFFKPVPK